MNTIHDFIDAEIARLTDELARVKAARQALNGKQPAPPVARKQAAAPRRPHKRRVSKPIAPELLQSRTAQSFWDKKRILTVLNDGSTLTHDQILGRDRNIRKNCLAPELTAMRTRNWIEYVDKAGYSTHGHPCQRYRITQTGRLVLSGAAEAFKGAS